MTRNPRPASPLVRLACLALCLGLLPNSLPLTTEVRATPTLTAAARASAALDRRRVSPAYEVTDLPSLDKLRRHRPDGPQAPAPVPSSRRRPRPERERQRPDGRRGGDAPHADGGNTTGGGASADATRLTMKYAAPLAAMQLASNALAPARGGKSDAPSLSALLPAIVGRAYVLLGAAQSPEASPLAGMLAQDLPNDAAFVSQDVPAEMYAGQQLNVTVRVQNTGSSTWTTAAGYKLGSQYPQDTTFWRDGRAALPGPVAPDQSAAFTFAITAPAEPGVYPFGWRMLREGVEWFGQYSPQTYILVKPNAAFVSQSVPGVMRAGQSYPVSVTMRNTSPVTWTTGANYWLGSRNPQDSGTWGQVRAGLAGPVSPNADATFNFTVTAPASPGVYNFQWQMLKEGLSWFGDSTPNVAVNVTADGSYTPPAAGALVVGEFRTGGPGGAHDEFVELYNKTGVTLTVSTADGSSGWALAALMPDGTAQTRFVVPAGTVLPAAGTFLAASRAYSLSSYGEPDIAYPGDIPNGAAVALFRTSNPANFTAANRLDAVAFSGVTNPLFLEGTPLAAVGAVNVQHSFVRNPASGGATDTNNNASDFVFVSVTGGAFGGVNSVLGAPGPAGMTSPLRRNSTISSSYVDPSCTVTGAATSACVRSRDYTPVPNGAQGTLSIRRRFTNNTGVPVHRLRFRVVDITTFNSSGYTPGGAQADIRLLSSSAIQVTMTDGSPVTIRGTTLEEPPAQAAGGGLGSSASVGAVTLGTPLAPGNSVNVQFLLGVQHDGSYRFAVNIEGDLGTTTGPRLTPTVDDFATARLEPSNRTGGAGVDLRSGNYNWGLPLVSLKGRAGLDLGLSLAYNSRVWTKSGSHVTFDADNGSPSPGFRLGFPAIQPRFVNTQTGQRAYLLITPNGGRVELRETGTAGLYESADSSYLQLVESGGGLVLRPADGSQLTFVPVDGEYLCASVKDRDGNYVTVEYHGTGQINKVTDTLGRVITFNYDQYQNLISITQPWWDETSQQTETHVWATFGWGDLTLDTNFAGLTQAGLQDGSTIPVLTQVGLPDGSLYRFDYTTWGQVNRVTRHTPSSDTPPQNPTFPSDYTARSSVYHHVRPDNGAESDCPRVSWRIDWAQYWIGGQDAVSRYAYDPGGLWGEATTPDGTRHKEHFGTGWQRGLTVKTESFAAGDSPTQPRKTTTTLWEQNNQALSRELNPRVTKTVVEDAEGNGRQTVYEYSPGLQTHLPAGMKISAAEPGGKVGLPVKISEADKNGVALRHTSVTYNLAEAYVGRRIIGLPAERTLHGAGGVLASKVSYLYDQPDEPGTPGIQYLRESNANSQQSPTVQHDPAYGLSFVQGRGHLNVVRRWSVSNPVPSTEPAMVESKTGYNTHGSVVLSVDPAGRRSVVDYADSFSRAAMNGAKFAYPTKATDADGFSSKAVYNYDFGAITESRSPMPDQAAPGVYGPARKMAYDKAGRLSQVTNDHDGAYTKWAYPASLTSQQTKTLLGAGVEAFAAQVFDGAGRVRAQSANMAEAGRYSGRKFVYDLTGRLVNQSNPTEIDGAWVPAGADAPPAGGGWVYGSQQYDWMGRPTSSTNADGSAGEELTYGGCGCAGGLVVTSVDAAGRRQTLHHDALGRMVKREIFNGSAAYSSTATEYNALDQATRVFVKDEAGGVGQETLLTYDGHGRVASSKSPIQTRPTTYQYYSDDTTWKVFTPREPSGGAAQDVTATFTYNGRGQVTRVGHDVPVGLSGTVRAAATVETGYDAAGNRLWMTDGMGRADYQYDALSRLRSETRQFTGLEGMSFPLTYTYDLTGAIKSVRDKWNVQVDYNYDAAGSLSSVTGSGYGSVQTYAQNAQYRASGAVKSLAYGNGAQLSLGYTSRLEVSKYKLTVPGAQATAAMEVDYGYGADGLLRHSTDHADATLNRAYGYDHAGRLTAAYTGSEASTWVQTNGASTGTAVDGPYRQSYAYDAWDNRTSKFVRAFIGTHTRQQTVNYTLNGATGRNTAWHYDAGGLVTAGDGVSNLYDAAGRLREMDSSTAGALGRFEYDGDGAMVRRTSDFGNSVPTQTYYLRSSVLGQTVAEVASDGSRGTGFVYAGGELLATQVGGGQVTWQHRDASGASRRTTDASGGVVGRDEVDPEGVTAQRPDTSLPLYGAGGGGGDRRVGGDEMGASPASLMDSRMCDFGTLLVPCAMVPSFQQHIDDVRESRTGPDSLTAFWETGLWSGASYGALFLFVFGTQPEALVEAMGASGRLGFSPSLSFAQGSRRRARPDRPRRVVRQRSRLPDPQPAPPQNQLPTHLETRQLKPSPEQQRCSDYLADLFGGDNAEAGANGFTPSGTYRGAYTYNGKRLSGHLSDFAIHISGSKDQTQDTDVFVPLGGEHTLSTSDPDGNTVDLFYYSSLNGIGAYTLAVLHLDRSPHTSIGGRLHIGRTGGPGGHSSTDRHVHIELLKGRWKKFPKPSIRGASRTNLSVLCPQQ